MRPRDLDLESQGQGHLKVIRAKNLRKMRFCFPEAINRSLFISKCGPAKSWPATMPTLSAYADQQKHGHL